MRTSMPIAMVCVTLSLATPRTNAQDKSAWTKEAAAAALAEVKSDSKDFPWKPVSKARGTKLTATAEIQAGTAIDLALTIPPGAAYDSFALYAKNGVDVTSNPAEWKACQTSVLFRCLPINAGYAGYPPQISDAGTTYQMRFVPDAGSGGLRARMVLTYVIP